MHFTRVVYLEWCKLMCSMLLDIFIIQRLNFEEVEWVWLQFAPLQVTDVRCDTADISAECNS